MTDINNTKNDAFQAAKDFLSRAEQMNGIHGVAELLLKLQPEALAATKALLSIPLGSQQEPQKAQEPMSPITTTFTDVQSVVVSSSGIDRQQETSTLNTLEVVYHPQVLGDVLLSLIPYQVSTNREEFNKAIQVLELVEMGIKERSKRHGIYFAAATSNYRMSF